MILLKLPVLNPDELMEATAFGAAAKLRLESSADNLIWNEINTVTLLTGTTVYEIGDASGDATTYYRTRYSTASPSLITDYGGYSASFRVTSDSWTTLERAKARTSVSDTTDDGNLLSFVDAANAEMTRQVGIFLGPSTDTSRTYDGYAAVRSVPPPAGWGTRLWIPGGIRTCTLLEIAPQTAAAFETIPATDYRLGPRSSELRVGQPYAYIEFLDITSGTRRYFPPGYDNVRPTGTFGYAAVPSELQDMATALVARMWKARDQGADSAYPFLTAPEVWKLENYRHENGVSM